MRFCFVDARARAPARIRSIVDEIDGRAPAAASYVSHFCEAAIGKAKATSTTLATQIAPAFCAAHVTRAAIGARRALVAHLACNRARFLDAAVCARARARACQPFAFLPSTRTGLRRRFRIE